MGLENTFHWVPTSFCLVSSLFSTLQKMWGSNAVAQNSQPSSQSTGQGKSLSPALPLRTTFLPQLTVLGGATLFLWMQTMYWKCFPRFHPNQLQKGKTHLEDWNRSLQKHLRLLNKEYYLCVDTCGHHHVTERIPRDREEDSIFCLQDESRLPADIHITFLDCSGMLQIPQIMAQIRNQINSFSPSHACMLSWKCSFVYSQIA